MEEYNDGEDDYVEVTPLSQAEAAKAVVAAAAAAARASVIAAAAPKAGSAKAVAAEEAAAARPAAARASGAAKIGPSRVSEGAWALASFKGPTQQSPGYVFAGRVLKWDAARKRYLLSGAPGGAQSAEAADRFQWLHEPGELNTRVKEIAPLGAAAAAAAAAGGSGRAARAHLVALAQRSPQTGRRFFVAPRTLASLVDRLLVVDDSEGRLRPAWVEDVDDGTSGGHGVSLLARFADGGAPADGEAVRVSGKHLVLGGESKALRELLDVASLPPKRGLDEALDARDAASSGDPALAGGVVPDGAYLAVGVFDRGGGSGGGGGGESLFVGRVQGFSAETGLLELRSGKRALLTSGAGSLWLRATDPLAHSMMAPGAVRALLGADLLPASLPLAVGAAVLADCGEGMLRAGVVDTAFDAAAGEYFVQLEAVPASAMPPAPRAPAGPGANVANFNAAATAAAGLPARRVAARVASLCLTAKGVLSFAALGRARAGGRPEAEPRVAVALREDPRKGKRGGPPAKAELAQQPLVPLVAWRADQARSARDRGE